MTTFQNHTRSLSEQPAMVMQGLPDPSRKGELRPNTGMKGLFAPLRRGELALWCTLGPSKKALLWKPLPRATRISAAGIGTGNGTGGVAINPPLVQHLGHLPSCLPPQVCHWLCSQKAETSKTPSQLPSYSCKWGSYHNLFIYNYLECL